jgi:pimeloyl-ACP methyl ester carboxylesterase
VDYGTTFASDDHGHHHHYFSDFPDSFALIADSEHVEDAIVFVHGFGGDAWGTWAQFHLMIDELDWISSFSNTDLYFFQYHSVWERVQSSTDRLLTFLQEVVFEGNIRHFTVRLDPLLVEPDLESPEQVSNELSALPSARQYRRVFLVGHSEGGVVIRNAVLKKAKRNSPLLRCSLFLFAPAIAGYAPAGLLGTLATFPGLGKVVDALLRASPAYQDLNDPDLLKPLRQKTEKEAQDPSKPAFRAQILWGRKDRVVKPDKYEEDEEFFEERSHIEICKPNSDYLVPVGWVAKRAMP